MKINTINKKEIEKFSKIAEEWWDPTGKFKPLHKFNPIRISYIKENILNTFKIKKKKGNIKRYQNFRYWMWWWFNYLNQWQDLVQM